MSEMNNFKDACTILLGLGYMAHDKKDPVDIIPILTSFIDINATSGLWKQYVEKLKIEYADLIDDFKIVTKFYDLKKIIGEKYEGNSNGKKKSLFANLESWTTSSSSFLACDGEIQKSGDRLRYPRSALTKGDDNDTNDKSSSMKSIKQLGEIGFNVVNLENLVRRSDGAIENFCKSQSDEYNRRSSIKVPIAKYMNFLDMGFTWEDINNEASVPKKYFDDYKRWSVAEVLENWDSFIAGSSLTYGFITKNLMRKEDDNTVLNYKFNEGFDEDKTEQVAKRYSYKSLQGLLKSMKIDDVISSIQRDIKSLSSESVSDEDPVKKQLETILKDIRQEGGKLASALENYSESNSKTIYREYTTRLKNIKAKYGKLYEIISIGNLGSSARGSSWKGSSSSDRGSKSVRNFLDVYDGGHLNALNISTIASTRPDISNLKWANNLLEKKKHLLSSDIDRLNKHIDSVKKQYTVVFKSLARQDSQASDDSINLGEKVLMATKSYVGSIKKSLGRFAKKQSEFVTWTNKTPFEYMIRWGFVMDREDKNGISPDDDERSVNQDHRAEIKKYFENLASLSSDIGKALSESYEKAVDLLDSNADLLSSLGDDYLVDQFDTLLYDFEVYSTELQKQLARQFSQNSGTIFDILGDTSLIVVYAIKAFRILLTWISLTIATAIFLTWYSDAVYSNTNLASNPPSILWFVAIYEGIDSLFNVMLVGLLLSIKYIFDEDGDFILNSKVVSATITDIVIVKLVDTFMSSIVASIVASKKYFRYRFEGDRAVRALKSMLLWTSSVNTLIPYFRFFT